MPGVAQAVPRKPIEAPHESQRTLCRIDTVIPLAGGRSKVRGLRTLAKAESLANRRSIPA
jgi:hypothetical protein